MRKIDEFSHSFSFFVFILVSSHVPSENCANYFVNKVTGGSTLKSYLYDAKRNCYVLSLLVDLDKLLTGGVDGFLRKVLMKGCN